MSEEKEMDIPSEILEDLQSFHVNLKKMEEVLNPLTTTNVNSLDFKIPPLERARLNLISGYALNSLYWMYLNTLGEDPKQHRLKTELERYKSFMQTVKEITDKNKAPVLDKEAAKRFFRNALWKPTSNNGSSEPECLNKPSCSTYAASKEVPHRSPLPRKIALGEIITVEQEVANHILISNTSKQKKRKSTTPQVLKLSKAKLSTLSCGICFVSAMQLKNKGKFPVFMIGCNHFICAPCVWRKKEAVSCCPTCQQPIAKRAIWNAQLLA